MIDRETIKVVREIRHEVRRIADAVEAANTANPLTAIDKFRSVSVMPDLVMPNVFPEVYEDARMDDAAAPDVHDKAINAATSATKRPPRDLPPAQALGWEVED
jgi:hypothetical protein